MKFDRNGFVLGKLKGNSSVKLRYSMVEPVLAFQSHGRLIWIENWNQQRNVCFSVVAFLSIVYRNKCLFWHFIGQTEILTHWNAIERIQTHWIMPMTTTTTSWQMCCVNLRWRILQTSVKTLLSLHKKQISLLFSIPLIFDRLLMSEHVSVFSKFN